MTRTFNRYEQDEQRKLAKLRRQQRRGWSETLQYGVDREPATNPEPEDRAYRIAKGMLNGRGQ